MTVRLRSKIKLANSPQGRTWDIFQVAISIVACVMHILSTYKEVLSPAAGGLLPPPKVGAPRGMGHRRRPRPLSSSLPRGCLQPSRRRS